MKYLFEILSLLGAIGLFLYGMKLMSKTLQRLAGENLRKSLSVFTSNKTNSIFSGLFLTGAIQYSSVVITMVVGFVSAGLLSVKKSIGIVFGANIGTTLKVWIISLIGLKVELGVLALPIIGICLPLMFSKNQKRKLWGEFAIGIAILFLGIDFMKYTLSELYQSQALIKFLSNYADGSMFSILLFVGVGILVTAIVQSSSATITLTLVMASGGWITFETAAALVLGENIGTTITANIAAIVANTNGKRVAMAHTLFNVIGVIWALIFFKWFLLGIDKIMVSFSEPSPFTTAASIPIALSILHTAFNTINTLLFIPFIPSLVKLTEFIFPEGKNSKKSKKMNLALSELSIIDAKNDILQFAIKSRKMFQIVPQLLVEKNETIFAELLNKIRILEDESDNKELELTNYLTNISHSELSLKGLETVKTMLRITSEIENISDSCYQMAKNIDSKNKQKIWFTQDLRDNLKLMFDLVGKSMDLMISNLEGDYDKVSLNDAKLYELEINKLRNTLIEDHLKETDTGQYNFHSGVFYTSLISNCERAGDFIFNVNESIQGIK
ncbi:MAG: Na/Pi cotransporter family protein [Bacteroidetes bacterium]|nr:Na/Pi cotransporter family protein [Bacteroidota bacterium]